MTEPVGLLKPRKAAAWLGISERSLWTITRAGDLAHVRVGAKAVRYMLSDLIAYAESRRQGGTDGQQ